MKHSVQKISQQLKIYPGQLIGALNELGITCEQDQFESESDILDLVKESALEFKNKKLLPLYPERAPRELAVLLGVRQPDIQKILMIKLKVMATLTTSLKDETITQLLTFYDLEPYWLKTEETVIQRKKPTQASSETKNRAPIVTIMGHVDHGKTTLLDTIRKTKIADKEHGGITQHIGAYQAELNNQKITFLDTPGHAAFTAMRARGAQVTDITILVVAADDGIMPQTIEAIDHAKNADVPIIVAVNKIDKPDANPANILTAITQHGLIPEAYGGQTIICNVSAKTGEGIEHLLEMILLQAEILNLQADPKGEMEGVTIEAKMEKGRGPVATVLVQNGTLKVGHSVVIGHTFGKIRAMNDYHGNRIAEAGPSTPVEILGLNEVPHAGENVILYSSEKEARLVAEERQMRDREKQSSQNKRQFSLKDLKHQLNQGAIKDLNLVVKADVQGSLEAVKGLLSEAHHEEVNVRVIHGGIGAINESDILLASAANAICVGFNVKWEPTAKKEAERSKVEIRIYNIIYELIEDIEAAVKGMLAPKFREQALGSADIRVHFKLSRVGLVAGSHVTEGKIVRGCNVRVIRNKEIIYEGKVDSLKHLKNDVREVTLGFECGIQFENWKEFAEGDVVEAFEMIQINE